MASRKFVREKSFDMNYKSSDEDDDYESYDDDDSSLDDGYETVEDMRIENNAGGDEDNAEEQFDVDDYIDENKANNTGETTRGDISKIIKSKLLLKKE